MIASIAGNVQAIQDQAIIIQVGGIGYRVNVPNALVEGSQAARKGQHLSLWTYQHVRENEISLYGFETLDEHDLFVLLIGVSGVGPRSAMAAISSLSPQVLRGAIAQGDAAVLIKIPGIGRKTAQRVVLDLREKVGEDVPVWQGPTPVDGDADVINALTALGYSVAEAQNALGRIPADVTELDQRILSALRSLGGS